MADSYNINTTQSQADEALGLNPDNPAMTYVDFGNQIAKNAQTQAEQSELIKQAQLTTQQRQAGAAQGINPVTKGYISKDEAAALIRAELTAKNLLSPDVETQIQAWYAAASDMVEQTAVKDFTSRYLPKEGKTGVPFLATAADAADTDKADETGKPLIADQMYSATTDAKGNVTYERGGQEKTDNSASLGEKDNQFWQRQWTTAVANKINPYLSSSRTQVGVALASYIRCTRALQTLSKSPITRQDAMNVIAEIGAVYKGGSPDQAQMLETQYSTLYGWATSNIQTLLGKAMPSLPESIRQQLVARVTDLAKTSRQVIENAITSVQALDSEIISHNQDQWDKFLKTIDKTLADPNAAPAGIDVATGASTGFVPAPTTPLMGQGGSAPAPVAAPAGAAPAPTGPRKTASGISYTVAP